MMGFIVSEVPPRGACRQAGISSAAYEAATCAMIAFARMVIRMCLT